MPTWLRVKCITTYLIYAFRKTVIYYCQLMIKKKYKEKTSNQFAEKRQPSSGFCIECGTDLSNDMDDPLYLLINHSVTTN